MGAAAPDQRTPDIRAGALGRSRNREEQRFRRDRGEGWSCVVTTRCVGSGGGAPFSPWFNFTFDRIAKRLAWLSPAAATGRA
jgi:hypothetical protein